MEEDEALSQFTNGSLSPEEIELDASAFRVTKIFFYFLILFASTLGNSMVAHIIRNTKKMRTASNYLILNLAICDLVTPLISIVFDFILEENGYVWFYGGVMCKLLWPAQTYFSCASSLNLAAISLDRYRLIMHPFKTRLSTKQIYFMILLVHVFSLAAVGPYVYVLSLHNGTCEEHWPQFAYRQSYTLFLFLVQYGLPLTFMAVVYGLAVRTLYNTSARISRNSINSNMRQTRLEVTGVRQNLKKRPGRNISRTKSVMKKINGMRRKIDIWSTPNAKAMKMFIVIVVVFAIFMFPNQVVWLWADFGEGINSPHFTKISIICWLFTYANSVVNPIIFGVFTKDFRRGFKKIFNSMIPCFSTQLEFEEASRDAKRSDCSYNKTASETLNVETVGINSQRNSLLLTPQNDNEHSRWSRTCFVKSFSEHDLDKAMKSMSKTSMLEGKLQCLNYDHLTGTSGEHSIMLPDIFWYGHPKDALHNLRETDC